MRKYLTLILPNETMTIDLKTGLFQRCRVGEAKFHGSESWVCTGAVRLNNFGHIVETLSLAQLAHFDERNESWNHNNGKAKWRVTDLDHGTHRIQMGTQPLYVHFHNGKSELNPISESVGRVVADIKNKGNKS